QQRGSAPAWNPKSAARETKNAPAVRPARHRKPLRSAIRVIAAAHSGARPDEIARPVDRLALIAITARVVPRHLARASEQPTEEAGAAVVAAVTTAASIHARRHAHGLRRGVRRTLDRDVGNLALAALQDVDHAGVAPVDIVAELQLAVRVDEGGLIGEMHPDRLLEVDVDLAVAVHALDAPLRVVFLRIGERKQLGRISLRILHAHAAVAVSSLVAREQVLVRRVVLVDEELVREIEANAA